MTVTEPAEVGLRALLDAATPGPWVAYFTTHGDPNIVTDAERPWFTTVAKMDIGPEDYGRANNLALVALRNNADALLDVVELARAQHCRLIAGERYCGCGLVYSECDIAQALAQLDAGGES